jgi:hypothetical protein
MASFISKLFDLSQRKNTSKYPEVKSNILQNVNINHPLVKKDEKTVSEELMELYIPFGRILPYYPPKYAGFRTDSYGDSKCIAIELDNQYFFNDGGPTISNPTMGGYNKPFILSVGIDDIERTKIKKVVLFVEIGKIGNNNYKFSINSDIEIERTAHCVVYGGQTTLGLSQLLSNDISSSNSFYELSVYRFRAQYVHDGINGINYFLREVKEHVKDEIISHFKTEVASLRKYVSERKNRIQFEETLNIDKVKECFIELFDNNSNELSKTEGNDYYYSINIPGNFSDNNSLNLNDEITELLFNISEGSNRIRGIYDCCIVNIRFSFYGINIDIKQKENDNICNTTQQNGVDYNSFGYADCDYFM